MNEYTITIGKTEDGYRATDPDGIVLIELKDRYVNEVWEFAMDNIDLVHLRNFLKLNDSELS